MLRRVKNAALQLHALSLTSPDIQHHPRYAAFSGSFTKAIHRFTQKKARFKPGNSPKASRATQRRLPLPSSVPLLTERHRHRCRRSASRVPWPQQHPQARKTQLQLLRKILFNQKAIKPKQQCFIKRRHLWMMFPCINGGRHERRR